MKASNGLKSLLCDTKITTDILRAKESLELVARQVQRDVMSGAKDDRDDGWKQIIGLDLVLEQILLFSMEGAADLVAEQASSEQKGVSQA